MSEGDRRADGVGSLLLPHSVAPSEAAAGTSREHGIGSAAGVGPARSQGWGDVPWRTIVAAVAVVGAAALLATVVYLASRIVVWVAVAGFFAVVLARPTAWLQARFGVRKGVAVGIVVGGAVLLLGGLLTLFVLPVRTQFVAAVSDLPGTVRQAADGRGPVGRVVSGLHLEQLVRDNEETLTKTATSAQSSFPALVGAVLQAVLAIVTVAVMACLMLSQSAVLARAGVRLVPVRYRATVVQVARDTAAAVSGYMTGNLLISLCAGTAAFVFLAIAGVPSALVLALWVAFADLLPLVGATLGAIVVVVAAFLVSPTIGIVAIVFFVLYQQFENSVLHVVVMSRTVSINPLAVLLSVLLGAELFGFVGALLAVPVAGAFGVIAKELWAHRPRSPDELVLITAGQDAPDLDDAARTKRRWPRARRRVLGPRTNDTSS